MATRIKIISTLPLMVLWFFFYEKNQWAVDVWQKVGLDITKDYDFFLFADHPQKIRWYIHYTAYYYTLVVLSEIIHGFVTGPTKKIAFVFYLFCIFRVIEYWLFRFHLGVSFLIAAIIIFSLSIHRRG